MKGSLPVQQWCSWVQHLLLPVGEWIGMCLGSDQVVSHTGAGDEPNGMKQLCSCSTSHASGLCSVGVIVGFCLDG